MVGSAPHENPIGIRNIPWGALGAIAIAILALAPVVYRLLWRPARVAEAAGDVTIEYLAWGNPQQLATDREVIRRFNAQCKARGVHERVELFMPPAGGYTQKILMMLTSDSAPDVLRIDQYDFASFAIKGYFKDLTDLAAADSEFNPKAFHPAPMRENFFQGRLYALNVLYGGLVCYYNADLFRHAGLADPYSLWKAGSWNWAAFDDAAKRLTVRDPAGRPVTFGLLLPAGPGAGPWPISMSLILWRFGASLLSPDLSHCTLDSPQSIAAVQYLRDLQFKSRITPNTSDQSASLFSFEGGNIAMTIDTAGNSPQYRDNIKTFDWDIAPTPSGASDPFTLVKGCHVVITKQSKHPREAWEWIKFLTSRQTELFLYGDELRRNVATRLNVLNSPDYLRASRPPFHTDVYAYLLDAGRDLPIDATWPTWTATMQKYLQRLFISDTEDTATVLRQATRAVDIDLIEQRARFERYTDANAGSAVGGARAH